MLDLAFPLARVTPAAYNPRAITDDAIAALCASIQAVGFCKPIIVTATGLLIAGHQRSRAARLTGATTVPAWIVTAPMSAEDEVYFNQMHNGTDLDTATVPVRIAVTPEGAGRFVDVPASAIVAPLGEARGAILRASMASLILKYGPWGCAIVDPDGAVIGGPHYALVCRQLGIPVRTYQLTHAQRHAAQAAFGRSYGAYAYSHLPKAPYIQGFAQPSRNDLTIPLLSRAYRQWALPALQDGQRLLDFGCGKGRHVRTLQRRGYHVHGIEFFPRIAGRDTLDMVGAHLMIDTALADLTKRGRFDVVIADFVVNSVQNPEAEADVLHCLNAFCKPGGRMIVTGRSIDAIARATQDLRAGGGSPRWVKFYIDADGFGGELCRGHWFFQKFHRRDEVDSYGTRFGYAQDFTVQFDAYQWFTTGIKSADLDPVRTEQAIAREFNLAWPGGRTVARDVAAVRAWREST